MTPSTSTLDGAERLDQALEMLCKADTITRPLKAQRVLSLVPTLVDRMELLAERATRFDACGGFTGTPWDRPARLRPRLWAGSFAADEPYPWLETLSTLRMLAVATGEGVHEDVDQDAALTFLERVVSLNMDKIMSPGSEHARVHRLRHHDAARALIQHVVQRVPRLDFLDAVAEEVDAIMAQRPVWTHHVRATLRMVAQVPGAHETRNPVLDRYVEAVLGPTPMAMRFRDPEQYREGLRASEVLDAEARAMGASLRNTGLACAQHAELLRHVRSDTARLGLALRLNERGQASLNAQAGLVADLIEASIWPGSEQTAYGLARCLETGVLEREEVVAGLRRVLELDVPEDLADALRSTVRAKSAPGPAAILLGGVLRVLGQPLGIGQGNNPTCQSARAISLWAQYRQGHLVDVLVDAVEHQDMDVMFEGQMIHSSQLAGGLAPHLDPELDPVSLVLVPHLDRIYDEMMKRATGRGDDPHKWVNPSFYGRMVPPGFSMCFEPITWQVVDHGGFTRRFYATFHPEHNEGRPPVYAVPVGITVTDDRGRLLGLHAVTLQRVAKGPDGHHRVYFYNPNNEGRQDWGDGVRPTVRHHGEREGESSLPFHHFASRLYAFHHPVRLPGEPSDVPQDVIDPVTRMARKSWGRAYVWAR